MQRYFSHQKKGAFFILRDSDMHHIKNVMRMQKDDLIEVIYDTDLYICSIGDNYDIRISKKVLKQDKFSPNISIVIPLLKEQKLDLILQKSTELGVDTIYITKMERTIVKIEDKINNKLKRWNNICKEAAEQSKRNNIPNVIYLNSFKEITNIEGTKIICSTQENVKNIKSFLHSVNKYDKLVVVIGPEGGLSLKEEDFLVNNGFIQISLGNQILRVETVPISILSIINYEFME